MQRSELELLKTGKIKRINDFELPSANFQYVNTKYFKYANS